MSVCKRLRRYRRHQRPRKAASHAKRVHLFESLELRAAPGSILFAPPGLISAVPRDSENRGALPAQPTPSVRHGRASSTVREIAGDEHLPFGDTDLATAQFQFSVMSDRSPTSNALVSSHDSPSDEEPLYDETSNKEAEHRQPLGDLAGRGAERTSSSGGSGGWPTPENLPDAATLNGLYGPSDTAPPMPTAEGEGPRTAASVSSAATDDANTAAPSSATEQGVGPAASAESPQVFQNPANPLDVNADGYVSPRDLLHVLNGLNGKTTPAEGVPGISLFLDVNGDGYPSPIDALLVITHLNAGVPAPSETTAQVTSAQVTSIGFHNGLDDWHIEQVGGTAPDQGSVRVGSAILTEGNSFLVTIDREIVIPDSPLSLTFTYEDDFDRSDQGFIRDAFEATLEGEDGTSLVHTFAAGREAFFNLTEGLDPAAGQGVTVETSAGSPTRVTLDLSQVFADTVAKLQFRLINNDADTQSTVRILDVTVQSGSTSDAPPQVSVQLANDTAPADAGESLRNDGLTNDPRLTGTAFDDHAITRLEVAVDNVGFVDITSQLVGDQYTFDPGQLEAGAHRFTVRATDNVGQTQQTTLDIQVNRLPVANAGGDRLIGEGNTVTFDGILSSDEEAEIYAYRWTFDDSTNIDGQMAFRDYVQDGIYNVTLAVIDTAGSMATETVAVTVENLPAVVDPVTDEETDEGAAVVFTTHFADPGILDTHMGTIDWGDGTVEAAEVVEQEGAGTISGSHTYLDDGMYPVRITVLDDAGTETMTTFDVVVRNGARKFSRRPT